MLLFIRMRTDEPFVEAIVKGGLTPTVICESAGTQSMDALSMKTLYEYMK